MGLRAFVGVLAVAAALAGYAVLSHLMMVHAPEAPWAVAAIFGPLVLAVGAAAVQRRHWPTAAVCAGLVAVLAIVVAQGGVGDVNRLYVLQHAGIHLVLAWTFAITLRAGATPRITGFAEQVHAQLSPDMRHYTRRLTAIWVVYFGGMVVVSLALYALAPWAWWSFFANVVTPLAALGLFGGEHLLRYWLHPEFERVTLTRALRAYRGMNVSPQTHRTTP